MFWPAAGREPGPAFASPEASSPPYGPCRPGNILSAALRQRHGGRGPHPKACPLRKS
ncbi:hypothetical protein DESPIG_02543 [Desulfovibrio piger ATCC 29098]|uniref:Uncharacterized protein n=1 Tax=Desulfovibrio piger ATCC 29098 TaxID=411464 RepID=B6WWS4_9BACT|nr:hypothetical protein DESPIG_02543 [Desulfovibrio piger ATCC 29098]